MRVIQVLVVLLNVNTKSFVIFSDEGQDAVNWGCTNNRVDWPFFEHQPMQRKSRPWHLPHSRLFSPSHTRADDYLVILAPFLGLFLLELSVFPFSFGFVSIGRLLWTKEYRVVQLS